MSLRLLDATFDLLLYLGEAVFDGSVFDQAAESRDNGPGKALGYGDLSAVSAVAQGALELGKDAGGLLVGRRE